MSRPTCAPQDQHAALLAGLAGLLETQAERILAALGLLLQKPRLCAAACRMGLPAQVSLTGQCHVWSGTAAARAGHVHPADD